MEVLGGVSSVFAVASLALQLSSNIQKLIEFWDTVKEAPDEIVQLKLQLRVLGDLLRCIELDTNSTIGSEITYIGIHCLQVCNSSILKLERVSRQWYKGLNGSGVRRRWTCLRKAMRERELAVYWDEIERAKSMLIMYQGWRNGQRHDSLLAVMVNLMPAVGEKCVFPMGAQASQIEDRRSRAGESGLTKVFLSSTIYDTRMSFGFFRVQISTHTTKPKSSSLSGSKCQLRRIPQKQITVSFIPGFLLSSVLECTISGGFCPQMTFKTFNVRPSWSLIFRYSAMGDLSKVRELIEDGQASPNDVEEDGWTPLHYAASCHHPAVCSLLIELGAATQVVTSLQQTPLLLASKSGDSVPRYKESYRRPDGTFDIDTVRVLVEQAKNDPMQADCYGNTCISSAAGNKDKTLCWLLNQDEYEIDLTCSSPSGHTAAAFMSTREDFPDVLEPLLRSGTNVNGACAKSWYFKNFYFLHKDRLGAPSMIHYAAWTWYDRLLSLDDRGHPPRAWGHLPWELPVGPYAAIRSLLDHGADLHAKTTSGHTILDGLLLNLIQFDGSARPCEVLNNSLDLWLNIVQQLGFDTGEYIRRERFIHREVSHDLGLGITMELRFCEDNPWAWAAFQGPEERERGGFVNHITKCCIWPKWQREFAVPKPPPPWPPTLLVQNPNAMFVIQSLESPGDAFANGSREMIGDFPRMFSQLEAYSPTVFWKARHYVLMGARYRLEFSFYFAIVVSFLGFGYFARIWTTSLFYTSLNIVGWAVFC